MQIIIVAACVGACVGGVVGSWLTWLWMGRQWKRNPYAFRAIVDGVIAKRQRQQVEDTQTR